MATKNYIKAKEYYNLQPGWVLHHKDVDLKKNDPERYNEWRIEDLVPMTKSEHIKYHLSLDNPMNYVENREKISMAMEKYKTIPRGTCCYMSEEDYHSMRSKMTSNRNRKMWQRADYREHMNYVMHRNQYQPVKCIETGTTYKCLRDAEKDFKGKISRPSISKSASNHITIKGYTFEFIEED